MAISQYVDEDEREGRDYKPVHGPSFYIGTRTFVQNKPLLKVQLFEVFSFSVDNILYAA